MTQKALKLRSEVEVHSVSCPGVFFPCKGPVHLSICFLGFHVKTKPFPPSFPLLFHDKFVFEKTFPTCMTLDHLQGALNADNVYMELLQETSEHNDVVLATFETSAKELLFPYPQLRGPYCAGVDVDLLMEPTKDFPGIISPKIEASTRTNIDETRHPDLDQVHDSAHVVSVSPPPIHKHPHLAPRTRSHSREHEDRDVFAWRKFDDELIHRQPKWHTMHDKPLSGPAGRPKSAAPGRMESDSSTEREHHTHHQSRPRSRARFGANAKHRAHSYTGPRRSTSSRGHMAHSSPNHHPQGPPHIPHHRHGHSHRHSHGSPPPHDHHGHANHAGHPHHGLPPHNDLQNPRDHSPPCRDTDPVPPPHLSHPPTPHHHRPMTPHHPPPTPHHGPPPPTPHHIPPTPARSHTPHRPHSTHPPIMPIRKLHNDCSNLIHDHCNLGYYNKCSKDCFYNSCHFNCHNENNCHNYCNGSYHESYFGCHDTYHDACHDHALPYSCASYSPACSGGFYGPNQHWSCHVDPWPPGPHLHSRPRHLKSC